MSWPDVGQDGKEGLGKPLSKPSSPCIQNPRHIYVHYRVFSSVHHLHQLSKPRGPGRSITSLGDLWWDEGQACVSAVLCHVMTYDCDENKSLLRALMCSIYLQWTCWSLSIFMTYPLWYAVRKTKDQHSKGFVQVHKGIGCWSWSRSQIWVTINGELLSIQWLWCDSHLGG